MSRTLALASLSAYILFLPLTFAHAEKSSGTWVSDGAHGGIRIGALQSTKNDVLLITDNPARSRARSRKVSREPSHPDFTRLCGQLTTRVLAGRVNKQFADIYAYQDCPTPTPAKPSSPPVSARQLQSLVIQATEKLQINPIRIGIVPNPIEKKPRAMGFVGYPVWMWADQPDVTTWGPTSVTATAGEISITATAKVTKVVWDMADGTQVECRSPGHRWTTTTPEDKKSPSCGHVYQKQGTYPITATAHWDINWHGHGEEGTLHLTRTTSATIVIGELQVVSRYTGKPGSSESRPRRSTRK